MAHQNWKDEERWNEYHRRDLTTIASQCSCYHFLENLSLNNSLRYKIHRQPVVWSLLQMVTTITRDQKEKYFTEYLVLREDFSDFLDKEECCDPSSSNRLRELIIVLIGQDLYEKCIEKYNKWQTSTLNPRYTPAYEPYYLVTLTARKEYKLDKTTHFIEKMPVFGSPPSPKVLIALLCSTDKWEFCHKTHDHQAYSRKRILLITVLCTAIFWLIVIFKM